MVTVMLAIVLIVRMNIIIYTSLILVFLLYLFNDIGGGHSTDFFGHRLFNFKRTKEPDHSIDPEFLETLRSECSHPSSSPSSFEKIERWRWTTKELEMVLAYTLLPQPSTKQGTALCWSAADNAWRHKGFGGILCFRHSTVPFHRDFGLAMFKLTHRQGSNKGEVRLNCIWVNWHAYLPTCTTIDHPMLIVGCCGSVILMIIVHCYTLGNSILC